MIILAGPCQIESRDHCMMMAERISDVSRKLNAEIIFKSSFDKANRTSGRSPRGVGIENGLQILNEVSRQFGLPTITDVHEVWQAVQTAPSVDILQIPALLCRQTDLVEAAALSGHINLKRGQFQAPLDVRFMVAKARAAGAKQIWVTERGACFGYRDLVVDMRAIPIMKDCGADAIIFDCTHSVQTPGSSTGRTGGDRSMTEPLARAAIAAGADGLFIETHNDPDNAPSDGDVMMPVDRLYDFLTRMIDLHEFVAAMGSKLEPMHAG